MWKAPEAIDSFPDENISEPHNESDNDVHLRGDDPFFWSRSRNRDDVWHLRELMKHGRRLEDEI